MNNADRFNTGFFIGATSVMFLLLVAKSCSQNETAHAPKERPCYSVVQSTYNVAFNDNDSQDQFDMQDQIFLEYQDRVELESSDSTNDQGLDDYNSGDGPLHVDELHVDDMNLEQKMEWDRARRHYNELYY